MSDDNDLSARVFRIEQALQLKQAAQEPQATGLSMRAAKRAKAAELLRQGLTVFEVAWQSGLSVGTVRKVAVEHGVTPRHGCTQWLPVDQRAEVERLLREGVSIMKISLRLGLRKYDVRKVATEIGWTCRWRKIGQNLRPGVGSLSRAEVVRLYCEESKPLSAVGALAGVTRERVRQVLEQEGVNVASVYRARLAPKQQRQAQIRLEVAERADRRRRENEERLLRWKEEWEASPEEPATQTMMRLANESNIPESTVRRLVYRARKERGWFPFKARETPVWLQARPMEDIYAPARVLWDEGLSGPEIARRMGISTPRLYSAVYLLRKRRGWFPTRKHAPTPTC